MISLSKFKDGGAAMLAASNRNHHIESDGLNDIMPLVRNDLRVWVIEYDTLARINRAEEDRPCAIIIIIAPLIPQDVCVRVAAIRRPMCPTDE
jgi:hypothetical protein